MCTFSLKKLKSFLQSQMERKNFEARYLKTAKNADRSL